MISDYEIGIKQQDYEKYLQSMISQSQQEALKINTRKGLPCGKDSFIEKLSHQIGKDLRSRSVGRPKKG